MPNRLSVAPSARRLTNSLRDVGYSFESAVADLVDNSVAAGADRIVIEIHFEGRGSYLTIADNGTGMHEEQINEAMRFGSRRQYDEGDLGRYGLGLKTASLSQCRRTEVVSRGNRLSSPSLAPLISILSRLSMTGSLLIFQTKRRLRLPLP